MKGKKGQLGKIMTSFPILILLILLMAVYLFIAGGMKITRGGGNFGQEEEITSTSILFKTIDVYGEEKSIFDALLSAEGYYFEEKKTIDIKEYRNSLEGNIGALLLEEIGNSAEAKCLFLGRDYPAIPISVRFENGKVSGFGGADVNPYINAVITFQFALPADVNEFRYVEMKAPGNKKVSSKLPSGNKVVVATVSSYYGGCLQYEK